VGGAIWMTSGTRGSGGRWWVCHVLLSYEGACRMNAFVSDLVFEINLILIPKFASK
jgi:hypothetical protein